MADLIDREALLESLKEQTQKCCQLLSSDCIQSKKYECALEASVLGRCIEIVLNHKIIDAEPVRHGRWIRISPDSTQQCSMCGHVRPYHVYDDKSDILLYWPGTYCNVCGCKMDLEVNDD